MNWMRMICSLTAAAVIAIGFNAPANAQTTDTVTATLKAGVISFSIDVTTNIGDQSYSHNAGYSSATGGRFTVIVMDDRNTSAGYSINLTASDFTRTGGGVIDLGVDGTLRVPTAGTVTRQAGHPTNLPTATTAASLTTTAVPILTAGSGFGNGHYTAENYAIELIGVAASVPLGTYTSTLTVTSPSAPL